MRESIVLVSLVLCAVNAGVTGTFHGVSGLTAVRKRRSILNEFVEHVSGLMSNVRDLLVPLEPRAVGVDSLVRFDNPAQISKHSNVMYRSLMNEQQNLGGDNNMQKTDPVDDYSEELRKSEMDPELEEKIRSGLQEMLDMITVIKSDARKFIRHYVDLDKNPEIKDTRLMKFLRPNYWNSALYLDKYSRSPATENRQMYAMASLMKLQNKYLQLHRRGNLLYQNVKYEISKDQLTKLEETLRKFNIF